MVSRRTCASRKVFLREYTSSSAITRYSDNKTLSVSRRRLVSCDLRQHVAWSPNPRVNSCPLEIKTNPISATSAFNQLRAANEGHPIDRLRHHHRPRLGTVDEGERTCGDDAKSEGRDECNDDNNDDSPGRRETQTRPNKRVSALSAAIATTAATRTTTKQCKDAEGQESRGRRGLTTCQATTIKRPDRAEAAGQETVVDGGRRWLCLYPCSQAETEGRRARGTVGITTASRP